MSRNAKVSAADVDSSTALMTVEAEKSVVVTEQMQQQERERLIAQCYQAAGQIKAAKMFSKFGDVSSLIWLRQVKDSKIYKDLPGVETWESFCDSVGLSRQKVDLDLQNLATFGEDFLLTVSSLSVGYRDLRKLRQLSLAGSMAIEGEVVRIGDEVISLKDKEDLQEAIERVLEELDEAQATVKAKDRVLESKDGVIKKQEKELRKLAKEAEGRQLLPNEDAFLQRMENLRISFDGYMLKADPDTVMNDYTGVGEVTPRMRAALISTLDYMKMQVLAAHDTAVMNFGDPAMTPEVMSEMADFLGGIKKDAARG